MVAANLPRDGNRLFLLAKEHGFQIIRDDARGRIVKYGTARFALPLQGDANHVASQAIVEICTTLDQRQRKPARLPLQVNYDGQDWAVYSQNSAQYELQSLEDGHRIWANKWEVKEVVENDTPRYLNGNGATAMPSRRTPQPDPEAEQRMAERLLPPIEPEPEPEPEPEKKPEELVADLGTGLSLRFTAHDQEEISPLAYSRNEMRKQIERTQFRIEQEEAKLKPLYDQLAAFQGAYAALSGQAGVQGPRRSTLKPNGNGRGSQAGIPKHRMSMEQRQQIRDYLQNEGKSPREILALMPEVEMHHIKAQQAAIAAGSKMVN